MSEASDSARPGMVDIEKPSVARAYDWYLGGSSNTAVDREFAERVAKLIPAKVMALDNRNFLRRCVTRLLDLGVRQFIDIGSGIPTVGNVHEVAQSLYPDTRVVYVDNDAVAVTQSWMLLEGNDHAMVVHADLRQPSEIVGNAQVREFLNFEEPTAILMIAVLHFIADSDNPDDLIASYCAALGPGSYLALSHLTDETAPPDLRAQIQYCVDTYRESTSSLTSRGRATLAHWMRNLEVVEPGITAVPQWHPDDDTPHGPEHELVIGAAGRIRN